MSNRLHVNRTCIHVSVELLCKTIVIRCVLSEQSS